MDTVTILRDLWRLRLIVAGVAILAALAGIAVCYRISIPPQLDSRKYSVGLATARILVDTPRSQVVEVAPKGSDSLGVRANLLASLMVDGVVKSSIAGRAGVDPDKLIGLADSAAAPAAVESKPTRRDFVLSTRVVTNTGGDDLPIIEVEAQAPDREGAAKLATAAVEGLHDYLDTKAATQSVPNADRLQVTGLGAAQAATVARGPSNVLGVVAALFLFVLGCAITLAVLALKRGFSAAAAREAAGPDQPAVQPSRVPDAPAQPATVARHDAWVAPPARPTVVQPAAETPRPAPVAKPEPQSWFNDPPRPSLVVTPSPRRRDRTDANDEPRAAESA